MRTQRIKTQYDEIPLFRRFKKKSMTFRLQQKKDFKEYVSRDELTKRSVKKFEELFNVNLKRIENYYMNRHKFAIFSGRLMSRSFLDGENSFSIGKGFLYDNPENIKRFKSEFLPQIGNSDFDLVENRTFSYRAEMNDRGMNKWIMDTIPSGQLKFILLRIDLNPRYDHPLDIKTNRSLYEKLRDKSLYVRASKWNDMIKGFLIRLDCCSNELLNYFGVSNEMIYDGKIYLILFSKRLLRKKR